MVVCFLLLLFEFPLEFCKLTVEVISLQLSLLLSGVLSVSCSCWELTHCLFVLDINSFFSTVPELLILFVVLSFSPLSVAQLCKAVLCSDDICWAIPVS